MKGLLYLNYLQRDDFFLILIDPPLLFRTSDMFFTAENVMRKELSSFVTSVKCQIIATEHNVDSTNTETGKVTLDGLFFLFSMCLRY